MPEPLAEISADPELPKTSPLSFLPAEEVAGLLEASRIFKLKKGEQAVRQERFPSEMLIVLEGRLKKVRGASSEPDAAGEMVEPHQPVGLDCLLSGKPYDYSLYADADTTICVIAWKILKPLIERTPGLQAYLRLVGESAAMRELDLTLEDMGCAPSFRASLLGAMKPESLPSGAWLAEPGEVPAAIYLGVAGTIQAYSMMPDGAFKALWIAPNSTWQLWDACLERKPAPHGLKATSAVEIYRLTLKALEALKESAPDDFASFAKVADRVEVEKEEEDEEDSDVERLEDLFPPPPKPVKTFRFTYPFVAQNDEMDCGPACMAMISKYYGNDLTVQFWRARMNTNQEGTSLFDLGQAADKVGFVSHGLGIPDLLTVERGIFPLIALRAYHYLVVYRADKSGVTVGDPAIGVRKMKWADFLKGYDGFVLMLKPTEEFYQAESPARGYGHYLAMLKGQELELWLILATSLMLTGLNMIPAFLSQFILDQVLAKRDSHMLALVLVATMVVAAMIGAVSWLRSYYVAYVTARFDFASMSGFMRKLFSLPYDFFATRHVGDFTRRLSELERVRMFVTGDLIETGLHFLNLAFYGVVLFKYSPQVAVVVYLSAPLLVGLSVLFSHRMVLQYGEIFTHRADQEGLISDQIKGMSTIKTLGAEVASRWRFEEALVKTLRARHQASLTGASLQSVSGLVNQLINFSVIGLAAYMAIAGQMTPGQVVSVSLLAAGVVGPFNALAGMWSQILEMRTTMDRLNDIFLAESESRPDKRALIKQRLRGEIEFRDVWFRYGGESTDWVLKGLTFRIPPGQSVAIVGPSGAGKSTLALLTARLYQPTKGTILIDGRDYREYDRQWLRRQIGLLLQENNLFHGSILENIAYGDPRPDLARVEAAAEMADAKGFIQEKSSGYDYTITHGGLGLSGGQKQRIAIARILYANPTILFLDEATSSLDAASERSIVKALKEARNNRTVLSIAHRYTTVRMSDFAMVISGGKAVEFGTHAELMKAEGHYFKLFGDQIES